MKRVLLFLANGVEIYEASAFIDVFGWNKSYGRKDVELFSCGRTKLIRTAFDVGMEVDYLLEDIKAKDFDALAVPGGFETYGFYDDAYNVAFTSLIQAFSKSNKPIASICVGALPLGKSGVLKGKKATTYNLVDDHRSSQLSGFGVNFSTDFIVDTDDIITSCGPFTAIDVALLLLEKLTDANNAGHIRSIMGF